MPAHQATKCRKTCLLIDLPLLKRPLPAASPALLEAEHLKEPSSCGHWHPVGLLPGPAGHPGCSSLPKPLTRTPLPVRFTPTGAGVPMRLWWKPRRTKVYSGHIPHTCPQVAATPSQPMLAAAVSSSSAPRASHYL